MMPSTTRQRSFRLPPPTLDLLDGRARETGESGNQVAGRLLAEGLRTDAHPLVRFRDVGDGTRQPALGGHRLLVADVIASVRANESDTELTARSLEVSVDKVRAAIRYYAEHREEIDAEVRRAEEAFDREAERQRREHEALA